MGRDDGFYPRCKVDIEESTEGNTKIVCETTKKIDGVVIKQPRPWKGTCKGGGELIVIDDGGLRDDDERKLERYVKDHCK